jgi:dTDP-4-amino-4,6-dideoxygalactose transaminase
MLMDPDDLESALTPATRAVMPVHLNGYPCELDRIGTFCERRGLQLVEDCAQAFGTRFHDRAVGSFGLGCFSLHPLKVFPAGGDGGFIATDDAQIAEALRRMRNLGLRDRDHCVEIAGNSRLDTMQAAMLLVKLEVVDGWIAQRRAHAEAYRAALDGLVALPPDEDTEHTANWSSFVIRHPDRDRLRAVLADAEVDAKIHYPIPIHRQKAFAHLRPDRPLPVTDEVVSTMLSLPVTPQMSEEQREHVIDVIAHAVQEAPTA